MSFNLNRTRYRPTDPQSFGLMTVLESKNQQ